MTVSEHDFYAALVRFHRAETQALRVLHEAELSLAVFDEQLARRKAHLRELGYALAG
jgi:hypothetical protein